jgi:putative transposase
MEHKGSHFCGDKGYDSEDVRFHIRDLGMKPHIKSRGQEVEEKKKGKSAKRWSVERTMSWINQYRRLKTRWEKKARNYEALCHFAFAVMAFKEAGVLG